MSSADELKKEAGVAFSSKNFDLAIELYTKAIELDPTNHVLFSNRSASLASVGRYEEALVDAEKVVSMKPDWIRGYSRKGAALHGLGRMEDAARAYQGGLKIDPSNAQLKTALQELLQSMSGGIDPMAMLGSLFNAGIYDDIAAIPALSHYLSDPTYKKMIDDIVENPSSLQNYFSDSRLEETIKLVLGRKMGPLGAGAGAEAGHEKPTRMEEERPKEHEPEKKKTPEEKPVPPPAQKKMSEEERKERERKDMIESLKKEASKLYFDKNFEDALTKFEECLELDADNVAILNNKAAVLTELGRFDEAVKVASETVELARRIHADYKLIARALERLGNAFLRQERLEEALECFRKSVTEFRNPEVVKRIKNIEADLKKRAELDYIDPEIALKEKEKGNDFFRSGDFAKAIECYKEAIRRNPEEHTLYNNLAAAYIKVGEFQQALDASEKCLEMKPDFVKGYARKGKALAGLKEYYKALKAFDEGMKLDPSNPELTSESTRVAQLMQREGAVGGDVSDKERLDRAMQDPEIRAILADPMLQLQLRNMQENPALAAQYMKDPAFADKVQKLISAGVIR